MKEGSSYVGIQAMPALGMAMMKQNGICDLIDSQTNPDPQRIISEGNGVMLMVGAMFKGMGRRPLYKLDMDFATAPLELMIGPGVEAKNLNARTFSRTLDNLFELDLPDLTFTIHETLCEKYEIKAYIYNMDSTNFSVSAINVERDRPGAAIPERNGHAKDGDNTRRVYNLQSVTTQKGILCYERPYDGSTTDAEMDRDTIEYLATKVDPLRSTIVADSKIVNIELIDSMEEKGFGFVSKCPESFGEKVKEKIVYTVLNSQMDPSTVRNGWEIYDCDATVGNRQLRFIAFRTAEGKERSVEYYREQGLRDVERIMEPLLRRTFRSSEDAVSTYGIALSKVKGSAYVVSMDVVEKRVMDPYGKRGRPPKEWVPTYHSEYILDITWEFSERLAEEMADARLVRVLITNLKRGTEDSVNPRDGVTGDGVLMLYLGQYRIEHCFRTSKSRYEVNKVYFHNPSRANAFMFVVSLATMIGEFITAVLQDGGVMRTAEGLIDDMSTLLLKRDPSDNQDYLEGPPEMRDCYMRLLEVLELDPDKIFG
ncbi:MAG: hypothetical protein A3208_06910 [Candidatus Methanoprimaticola hominis]|nr:MAG: hypothetical protein A3208_06910 [Methanomassiliicoccales archaeon Mx-06]